MASAVAVSMNEKLKQITLTQTVHALESARKVFDRDFNGLWDKGPARIYERRLTITIYIAKLYSGLYSKDAHRVQRLLGLLEQCLNAADVAFWEVPSLQQCALDRERQDHLHSTIECLRGCSETLGLICDDQTTALSLSKRISDSAHDPLHGQGGNLTFLPMLISVADYMKQTPKYDRDRQAPATLLDKNQRRLTEQERAGIIIQRLNVGFQRLCEGERALSFGVEPYAKVHSKATRHSYVVTNAIWSSPMFQTLGLPRDRDEYERLHSALGNSNYVRKGGIRNPMHIARGLRRMKMDLGIILQDEPDIVCWPLGRSNGDRFVIIYKAALQYSAVRLLDHDEMLPQRPTEPVLAINKPFPFLRLPSELRNAVYEHYLEVSTQLQVNALNLPAELPPLCNTNRQLRKEVAPIFLASRIFNLRLDACASPGFNVNRMLVGRNSWQECTKEGANFRRILFSSQSAAGENYGLIELASSDSKNGRGFQIKSGEGDFFVDVLRHRWSSFEEMVGILVQDSVNGLFTLSDMAALADFFCDLRERAANRQSAIEGE